MADERTGTPDLSKIVGLIMENPHLVEEISKLASTSGKEEQPALQAEEPDKTETVSAAPAASTSSTASRRSALLTALKPFLSESRANAIDSMLTFSEVFDVMRSGR